MQAWGKLVATCGIKPTHYHFWWLARAYIIQEMRHQGSPALPQRPTSSLVEKSIPLDRQSSWPPLQSQPPVMPSPSATESNRDKLNRPATETLSVSREEVLKGVIIKGIVCVAPKHPRVKSPTGSASNPFEKRAAPAPPTASQRGSESEPKTKAKNRSR